MCQDTKVCCIFFFFIYNYKLFYYILLNVSLLLSLWLLFLICYYCFYSLISWDSGETSETELMNETINWNNWELHRISWAVKKQPLINIFCFLLRTQIKFHIWRACYELHLCKPFLWGMHCDGKMGDMLTLARWHLKEMAWALGRK